MLGDPIGYAQGSVVSSRVLEPIENEVNLEISFQGRGEILAFHSPTWAPAGSSFAAMA